MGNIFTVATPLLHGSVKLTGLTPQTIEVEPGTVMKIWVPKETVKKNDYVPPTKPAVVFLHGFATDGIFSWNSQLTSALTREYAVYVPDLLFFGGSTTDRSERSPSFQAEFVAKGLRKLKVEKVIVVGLSYGATAGFQMAKLYPGLVKALVVSGTVVELTESISQDTCKRLGLSGWSDLLLPENVDGLKRMFDLCFHKAPAPPGFFYRHFLERMFSNKKEKQELLDAWVVPNQDGATYTNYQQEIHMLWGDDDKIFTLDLAKSMKTQLGDKASLEWIKDAGHLVASEQASSYNKHLKRILEHVTKDD